MKDMKDIYYENYKTFLRESISSGPWTRQTTQKGITMSDKRKIDK